MLSREALRRFSQVGLGVKNFCQLDDGGDEDVNMGEAQAGCVGGDQSLIL